MTLFVLLPASARARIVAANLGASRSGFHFGHFFISVFVLMKDRLLAHEEHALVECILDQFQFVAGKAIGVGFNLLEEHFYAFA